MADKTNYLGNAPLSANIYGEPVDIRGYDQATFQVQYEADNTPAGTWQIQGTNDLNIAAWEVLAEADIEAPATTFAAIIDRPGFIYLRVAYIRDSGGTGDVVLRSNFHLTGHVWRRFES